MFSKALSAVAFAGLASAAPMFLRRQEAGPNPTDVLVMRASLILPIGGISWQSRVY
jgi:hypothetical protein